MLGTLAWRLHGLPLPEDVALLLSDARAAAENGRRTALWEAEMARRALAPLGVPVVLLKGTAFVAAGLAAGQGRSIGDLDILVPREALDAVEAALIAAGWEWVKPDPYDDAYYRRWMHELPPLIHAERDRMIDVHHTILPLTARVRPDATALIADAVPLGNGLSVPSSAAMIVHAAAHLLADGDLAGGLRNLWDIHRLYGEVAEDDPAFGLTLVDEAGRHGLYEAVERALRLSQQLFGTQVGAREFRPHPPDTAMERPALPPPPAGAGRLGRATRPVTRLAFYVRSHWLRMPPAMLARHLWISGVGAGLAPPLVTPDLVRGPPGRGGSIRASPSPSPHSGPRNESG
ncbi:nucleotidyltransferase family protein [Sphingomonas sp. WKB10]|nr:nucleotidyltransferase family protein [Sphingomonas sp. WKB10]